MKISIGTWNISECVPTKWDLNNDIDNGKMKNYVNIENEIIKIVNDEDLDIICFQEFPITINGKKTLIDALCSKTDLKYCVYIDTCPSFLFTGGRIGVAIFSRLPIDNHKITYFNNPNLTKTSKKGQIYHSFDKAIITTDLYEDVSIMTCHAIGFVPFDKDPKDYPDSYRPLCDAIIDVIRNEKKLILAGDLNMDDLIGMFPELQGLVEDKLLGSTIVPGFHEGKVYAHGLKQDCIYVTNQIEVTNVKKTKTFSDHYLCTCQCSI